MTDRISVLKKLKAKNIAIVHQNLQKAYSQRPTRKNESIRNHKNPIQIPEGIASILMKQKLQKMQLNGEKISIDSQQNLLEIDIKHTQETKSRLSINFEKDLESCQSQIIQPRKIAPAYVSDPSIEINLMSQPSSRFVSKGSIQHIQFFKKNRYRKKVLDPIPRQRPKMSNNVRDYLSVEKILIKQMEEGLLCNKMNLMKQFQESNLLATINPQREQMDAVQSKHLKILMGQLPLKPHSGQRSSQKNNKFKPPFSLYYYRDFMWKVAYSNNFLVLPVNEYEVKIKYFVGKGNNSNLIKGILRRRPWFQPTQKIQEAQMIWTQIKVSSVFQMQIKGSQLTKIESKKNDAQINFLKDDKNSEQFSLFNSLQNNRWKHYWNKYAQRERNIKQNLAFRTKSFDIQEVAPQIRAKIKIHNHFCNNYIIGNKKALFQTMSDYYSKIGLEVFNFLPLTFHIKNGLEDDEYLKFLKYFYAIAKTKNTQNSVNKFNAWIIKPGQNTNRGNGIIVCLDLNDIKSILRRKQKHQDGSYKTYIVQKYIQKPLLYKKRKFDLRHYFMLNCSNGRMKGYWYRHGYVRTTSSQYTLDFSTGSIHLTNDAVQKCLPDYGKYEKGNKITYQQLDSFIKRSDSKFDFFQKILPKMRNIAKNAILASAGNIDQQKKANNFQIFGLDFMIDSNYDVWLIQINTNPCLETTCPVLSKIIPKFIQNTFQICVDPLFPAPLNFESKFQDYYKNLSQQNNFQLVFDDRIDQSTSHIQISATDINDVEEIFDDDGQNFQD